MNNKQHITKAATPRLTTFALASAAVFAAVQSVSAGVAAPSDWYQSPDWNLDVALVGDSSSAFSSGQAALEVSPGLNATIAETGSWTGLELEDPLAIAFADYGMLALGGDLTVATDYQDEFDEGTFLSGAVAFFNGGVLSGDGNITITSNSQNSIAPLVLAGVYSNDIGGSVPPDAVESEGGFESGSLDISGYSGAIVVTNDNSVGPATVGDSSELPISLPFDVDLSKSAVAVGIAAVESDSGINLGTVYGSLDQVVTTTAKSRNAEAFVSGDEESEPNTDALTAAAAVGALGYFNDGVGATADITTSATSGSAVSVTEFDTANALTVGLAVGLGGVVEGIEGGATITTTANSGFAQATSDDNVASSNTVAIAAGVVGLVYAPLEEEPDAVESDAPAVTTIATTATSSTSAVAAAGPAEAASAAIAVGMGGMIEDLSNTTLTTTATSGAVTAESSESDAAGLSISAAIGVVGEVGSVEGTTITSTATSAAASATESEYAGATTMSIAGGILGYLDPETADITIDATATAADATATGAYSAIANADALAFGVEDIELLYYALESVGPIFGDFFLEDILGDGLGSILGDTVVADAPAGPPELIAQTIALDVGVTANAKNATATIEFSEESQNPEAPVESDEYGKGSTYASASALAVGTSDLGGDSPVPTEISGTVDVTANAAIATASGNGYSDAEARADAYGLDDVYGNLNATITVAANAGTASATSTNYSAEASAGAQASAIAGMYGDLAGTVSATATAGTATATSSTDGSNASAHADATGVDGDLEGSSTAAITVTANGGSAEASSGDFEDWNYAYETSAYASGSADAVGIAGTVTPLGYEPEVESDDPEVPTIAGTITVKADAGDAESDSTYLDGADSRANTSAWAIGIEAEEHDFVANLNATIDIDALGGEADAYASFSALADADAVAQVIGDVENIESDIAGTIDADAVGGDAYASANAGAEAYADASSTLISGDDDSYDVYVNHTATTTLNATGGYAEAIGSGNFLVDEVESADPQSTIVYADADAFTGGFVDFGEINGEIGGSLTLKSLAGQAYAAATLGRRVIFPGEGDSVEADSYGTEAEASAVAEALGIEGDVFGEVSADISLTAGAAIVRDLAPADVVEGSEVESIPVESSPVAIADAFNAFGGEAHADASAYTTGINGNVYGAEEGDVINALTGSFTQNAFGGIAIAASYDDFFIGNMDAIESNELEEEFSIADYYDVTASAVGDSFGVDGDVNGDVTADFTINATGGEAYASGSSAQTLGAVAYGDAAGIYGSVDGDYDATMNVTATGGKAIVETVNSMYQVVQIGSPDGLFADASAIATGIGGANANAIDGNVAGIINVTATGGEAGSLLYDDIFDTDAVESVYVEEYFDGLYVAEGAFNAYAQAVGLNGNVDAEEVSAAITATATGGEVVITNSLAFDDAVEGVDFNGGSAGAFAAGIAGQEVIIDDVTGDITATATAGSVGYAFNMNQPFDAVEGEGLYLPYVPDLPITYGSNSDYAFAAGIMSYTPFTAYGSEIIEGEPLEGGNLDITISSAVHAYATSPDFFLPLDAVEGDEVLGAPIGYYSYAAAVYGAQGDDSVELADGADIVGDINLGGGANELKVIGNSIMEGNILSTSIEWIDSWLSIDNGAGTVDFDVDSGYFTAVRTVEVSDLFDTLVIGASGGLAPILSQDPEDGDTSLIAVSLGYGGLSADVQFEAGSSILPVFADTVDLNSVVGNEYAIVITQDGVITDDGAVVDNSETPFEYSFEVRSLVPSDAVEGIIDPIYFGEEGILTVVGAKDQDEEETPGTVQTNQAVNSSSQAVMIDISKHAALLRTLLRSSAQAPTGASGPEAEKMQKGEWLSYISVFGNIGQQESSGGYAGFDYDTYGMVIGQEKLIGDQLIVGIGGGYAETDIDGLDGSGGGDSELYSVAVYANWFTDTWYAEGGLTYGHASSDVVRIDFKDDRYTGDYDSDLIGTWIELGYTSAFGDFGLEPYARATYIHGEHDGFTDSGPDALVLTTEDNETDNFKTELGARLNYEWVYEDKSSFLVEVKAAWEHEWGDEGVSVNSSYLGDDTLTLQSAEADEDAIVLGLRAQWSNGEGFSLGFEYEPTFAGNWYNHAFSGTLQYNW